MSLQQLIQRYILSLLVLFVMIFGMIVLHYSIQQLHQEVESKLNSVTSEKKAAFYHFLKQTENIIQQLGYNFTIANNFTALEQSYSSGVTSRNYQTIDRILREAIQIHFYNLNVYDVFIIDMKGEILFTLKHEEDFATNILTGPYKNTLLANAYKKARYELKSELSQFLPYPPTDNVVQQESEKNQFRSAFIASPIIQYNKIIGIVAIQMTTKDFFLTMKKALDLEISQTGENTFFTRGNEHAIAISPLNKKNNQRLNMKISSLTDRHSPINRALNGEQGVGEYIDYNGDKVIAAWRYLPELDWGLVVKVDTSEAYKANKSLIKTFLLTAWILLMCGVYMIHLISQKITKPIRNLTSYTKSLTPGNNDKPIELNSFTEINLLADTFNHLTRSLSATLHELTQQKKVLDQHSLLAIFDPKGRIIHVNKHFCQSTGYTEKELIGYVFSKLNSGKHSIGFYENICSHLGKYGLWQGEICHQSKAGGKYWVNSTILRLKDEFGGSTKFMSLSTDITKEKTSISLLDQSKKQLNKQVIELELAYKDLEQFAYIASHDLKSPLTNISQLASWIAEDCENILPKESKTHLNLLKQRTNRMLKLLGDLLEYSRVGHIKYEYNTINLRETVQNIQELDNLPKLFTIDVPSIELYLPVIPLEIVLRNIITNAIKHHHKDEGVITIRCQVTSLHCIISIKDDGPGISKQYFNKVFCMFETLESRDRVEGSGMGLAMVLKIMNNYNGSVKLESEENSGCNFILTWPNDPVQS